MPTLASLHDDVTAALAGVQSAPPARVFFVACGGSLSIMYPAKFLLDQHSALPSDLFNAAEFTARASKGVGSDSLVILCSMTGTTRETVAAAEFARSRGARTIGLTTDVDSPLGKACDHAIGFEAPYTTGVPIDARNSNYARMYQLLIGLVALTGGEDLSAPLMQSLAALQPAIDRAAIEKLRADQLANMEALSKRMSEAIGDAAEVLTPEQRKKLADRFPPDGRGWGPGWHHDRDRG